MSGEIHGSGLLFTPAVGSTGSVVGPGIAGLLDPDAVPSTDDSQYKYVADPGTSSLTLTANSSGSIRIDVVECSRVQPDTILETDNRDVFNTVTGLFAASTVNKVSQAQLQYRIRTGTPGAGFPGTAQGWLPLAVLSVPNATTVWDTVTVWDVRPLLSDRIFQPFAVAREMPLWLNSSGITVEVDSSMTLCTGTVEVSATDISLGSLATYSRRRLGGRLRRGTPGTDLPVSGYDGLDLADAANQSGMAASATNYLYLVEPFGLPRWARYTDFTAGVRQPRSPRGIPMVTGVAPMHFYGAPSSPLTLPSSTGLGATTTSKGICLLALGMRGSTSQPAGASLAGRWASIDHSATSSILTGLPAASITLTQMIFVLTETTVGGNVPPFARNLEISIVAVFDIGGGGTSSNAFTVTHADLVDSEGIGGNVGSVARFIGSTTSNSSSLMLVNFRIPWPTTYGQTPAQVTTTRNLVVNYTTTSFSPPITSATLYVSAWETY